MKLKYSYGVATNLPFVPTFFTVLIIAQQLSITEPRQVNYSICETVECLLLALSYKRTLNFSTSPCDDFLTFTCGIVMENAVIPDNRVDFNVIGNLRQDVKKHTIDLLQSPEIDIPKNTTEAARAFYQGCLETENLPGYAIAEEINKLLQDIGGMPLVPATNYDQTITWPMRISKVFRYFEVDLLIGMEVGPDLREANSKLFSFYQTEKFGLSRADLISNDTNGKTIITAYKKYIKDSLCVLTKESCVSNTEDETTREVEKIVDFEIELAKLTLPPEKRRDFFNQFKKKTIGELEQNLPTIPWMFILKDIFKDTDIHVDQSNVVGFMEPEFFHQLPLLLQKTDPRTIANYIGWRVFQIIPVFYTKSLRIPHFEFQKVSLGYKELPKMEEICANSATAHFPISVGRLYIEKFFPPDVKKDLEEMIRFLKDSMRKMLLNLDWMDEITKKESLKKLDKIKHKIGYPSWIMNNTKLDEEEGLPEPFDKRSFVVSVIKYYKYGTNKHLREFNKPYQEDDWQGSPATVNAFYDSTKNTISFPAGILQPPLYQLNTLRSINFGSIGSIIGHEITHGFDDVGNQFDGDGNLRNWWTNNTKIEFNKRKQCFIDQYGNITDEQTNLKLNGEFTVGENIADNGGLQQSYDAYLTTNPIDERLPGLEHLTHKQLFFISFGRAWCGKYRSQVLRNNILSDPHTPVMYRVFMPPKNFKAFAEAFNCLPGSAMNPKERCVAW